MTSMECAWGTKRNELALCGTTDYVLGYVCDKCGNKGTVDLCPFHLDMWGTKYPEVHCATCHGTLSWEARNIYDGEVACLRYNQSSL
jgi:hypothetical protein